VPRRPDLLPHTTLWKNLEEVDRLLQIHAEIAGQGVGYKHNVSVLNKSAIVLLVACWESFVEDLAETAFSILLRRAKTCDMFSKKVLVESARPLRQSQDEREVWRLAGDGWKAVLKQHKTSLFSRYTGNLNTPRADLIDALYESLLGINAVSSQWHWHSMTASQAKTKLSRLIEIRGSIAHRVASSSKVLKKDVRDYAAFINRIAVCTSNAVRMHVLKKTNKEPWPDYSYIELPTKTTH
jgi:hypothetical protein